MYAAVTEPIKLLRKTIIFKYGKDGDAPIVRTVEVDKVSNVNDRGEVLITGRDFSREGKYRSFWIDPRHVTIVSKEIVDAFS